MIVLRDIYKYYKEKVIFRGVSCTFEDEKIYGVYGEAGCGKTALLQLLIGFINANNGTVSIDGEILQKEISFPRNIGYSIGHMEFMSECDCYENLAYLGMSKDKIKNLDKILDRVGLSTKEKYKDYTEEMRQWLKLVQAICQEPEIILLDEPTIDLSSRGKKRFWDIVNREKGRGATVIITMREAKELREHCDCVYELKEGILEPEPVIYEKES